MKTESKIDTDYNTIVLDAGSGISKIGFAGEDGPRSILSSIVGVPKMPGLKIGMEQQERYVGENAILRSDIMNFVSPIQRGEITDWEKYETLLHHLFYNEMQIVPEEINIMVTESPLCSKKKRKQLSEILFETYNVQKIHIANSSMLGLFAYGKTSGLVLDSGAGITSTVPIYEGFPLQYASTKMNIGGEDLSLSLLESIKGRIDSMYKEIKGRILADDIKEKLGFIKLNKDEIHDEETNYKLPDGKLLPMKDEVYRHNEILFYIPEPEEDKKEDEEEQQEENEENKTEQKTNEENKNEENKDEEQQNQANEEIKEEVMDDEKKEKEDDKKGEEDSVADETAKINKNTKRFITEVQRLTVTKMIIDSILRCDDELKNDIKESICIIGGNTLLKGFYNRLKNDLSSCNEISDFNLVANSERQFSSWIGGSIVCSLKNFKHMWVTKEEFDELGGDLMAVDSKCF